MRHLLLSLIVVSLVSCPLHAEVVLRYTFNNGNLDGTVYDTSGHNNDGTFSAGTSQGFTAGYGAGSNYAVNFTNPYCDATNGVAATQWITLPDLTSTLGSSDYTIALRYKTSSTNGCNNHLLSNDWVNGNGIVININAGNRPAPNGLISQYPANNPDFPYGFICFGDFTSTGTPNTADGKWHWLALTVNRSTQSLAFYVDGQLMSGALGYPNTPVAQTGAMTTSFANLTLGAVPNEAGGMIGAIDDFQVWNEALSASYVAINLPEPATWALLATGFMFLLAWRIRRPGASQANGT